MNTADNGILYLGSLFGETGSRYIGYVDDLQIYTYALNATEVSNLFNNNTLTSENFTSFVSVISTMQTGAWSQLVTMSKSPDIGIS